MVANLLRAGDKVDIRLVQSVQQEQKTGKVVRIYKSSIHDISEDGDIWLTMPMEAGRLVLLPLGVRFEFVFYSSAGLYCSEGQVVDRYKEYNIYILKIELHSQLKKYQRREYYRYPCLLEATYYVIEDEELAKKKSEEIFEYLHEENFYQNQYQATILDLSGGGVRFVTNTRLEVGTSLLLVIHLCNDKMDKQYAISGHVLEQQENEDCRDTRVEFIFQDSKIREEIIRYIFEEERKNLGSK